MTQLLPLSGVYKLTARRQAPVLNHFKPRMTRGASDRRGSGGSEQRAALREAAGEPSLPWKERSRSPRLEEPRQHRRADERGRTHRRSTERARRSGSSAENSARLDNRRGREEHRGRGPVLGRLYRTPPPPRPGGWTPEWDRPPGAPRTPVPCGCTAKSPLFPL